jgi:hypothetical protein
LHEVNSNEGKLFDKFLNKVFLHNFQLKNTHRNFNLFRNTLKIDF